MKHQETFLRFWFDLVEGITMLFEFFKVDTNKTASAKEQKELTTGFPRHFSYPNGEYCSKNLSRNSRTVFHFAY